MVKSFFQILLLFILYFLIRIVIKILFNEDISNIKACLPILIESVLFAITFFFISKKIKRNS